jgi:hypothetical protein
MPPFFGAALEPGLKDPFICGSGGRVDNRAMKPAGAPAQAFRRLAAVSLLLAGCVLQLAWADGRDDHERARAAVLAGEVLPLATVLERLQRTHPGQVLELELDREDGRWIYEIKLLQPGGQLLKLEVDARTGQVLAAKARPAARPR